MDQKKMKIVIVSSEKPENISGFGRFIRRLEQEDGVETACLFYVPRQQGDLIGEIKAMQPRLLITVNLPGFDRCTLTDGISYNLLDCRQLHLLLHENLSNEEYLKKQLSIAMFFYCAGNAYYERLKEQYPNLPYLEKLPDWQAGTDERAADANAEALYAAFREVLREGFEFSIEPGRYTRMPDT